MDASLTPLPAHYRLYDLAFRALNKTRIARALEGIGGARGIIFALHHVRPLGTSAFGPNQALAITPDFLDAMITHVRSRGFTFLSLDDALQQFGSDNAKPFAVLTFDDGYRDFETDALPIVERHQVPADLFITTGFADRSVTPWWLALEAVIRSSPSVCLPTLSPPLALATDTTARKYLAFETIKKIFLTMSGDEMARHLSILTFDHDIVDHDLIEATCLDWNAIRDLSRHPLLTIGAHSVSHPFLAHETAGRVVLELARSRGEIEYQIDQPVRHFAYPSGSKSAAGPREFSIAKTLGFASALTTRPGLVYDAHEHWATVLPRVSLNGHFQSLDCVDTLLSGVPFLLKNRGARLVIS